MRTSFRIAAIAFAALLVAGAGVAGAMQLQTGNLERVRTDRSAQLQERQQECDQTGAPAGEAAQQQTRTREQARDASCDGTGEQEQAREQIREQECDQTGEPAGEAAQQQTRTRQRSGKDADS